MRTDAVNETQSSVFTSPLTREKVTQSLYLNLLSVNPQQRDLISDWSHRFEKMEFQLGESILDFSGGHPHSEEKRLKENSLYLVCQGQIRLLSLDPNKQRHVSTQVLEVGDSFGGDSLFCSNSIPYLAIASEIGETVQIAKISDPQPWLSKIPELKKNWSDSVQQRQCLLFLKTLTELRTIPSHSLPKLLPYVQTISIPPQTNLAEATPAEKGHFWLRQGEIQPISLPPGTAWGYPDSFSANWVSETSLQLYYLPKEHWQAVSEMIPTLTKIASKNGHTSPAPWLTTTSKQTLPTTNPHLSAPSTAPPPYRPSETNPVVKFPRPQPRRRGLLRGYPFIEQQSSSDCGAACLVMISRYWNKRLGINTVRELANVGRSGASLNSLGKAAERLGYITKPVRASLNELLKATQKKPWIAHWQGDHYLVVYRVQRNKILVADPAQGKRTLSRQAFIQGWTGYALLLEPTGELQDIPDEKRSLGTFFKLLVPYRSVAFQVIATSLLIQVFGLVTPLFTQIILDQVVVNRSLTMLNVFALGVLLFTIWEVILSGIRQYLLSYLSNALDLTMIGGFIRHTLMLPLKFFESRHVGDIITRVNENQKIQQFLLNKVVLAWLDLLMSVVYLGLMFYYNWRLTLLILGIIPPIMLLTLAATPLLRRISREIFNQSADQNSALVETITGIGTVKATASERELRWRWEDRLTGFLNARFRGQKLGINLQVAGSFINGLGTTALLWYGATLVIQGELTIGQFVAFNMLIGKVLEPVLDLAGLWDELQEVLISVERLNDVFTADTEEKKGQGLLVLPPIQGEVTLENVTFRYQSDESRNTLENITFRANPGETVAIVGRSGSGKSTLVKLLQGLYQPDSGRICIDDHDLSHVYPQSLRAQLGVVPQECFLFSGTILDNITLYRQDFTLAEAIEVAKLAEAHAFIQGMPLGYNTKVGERGSMISGGQRQRIAIARALLGKPPILILDEATSSLDTESERRFQENLSRLSRDRTTFIIAHRLSTVRNADCILVLDQGLLVEQGTHEQLMANQKLYYHLAQQQLNL